MALKRDAAARIENLKILELSENATKDEVRKAYTRLALRCHPDKNPDDPVATEKFQNLSRAYEELTKKARVLHRCPQHGAFVCDSDEEDSYDDDEFISTEDEDLLEEIYEKIFFELLARDIFRRRFCAKKKRKPPTEEEKAEERFYEFLRKKYQDEESEDDFVLTEEDLKKFHSYEAWEEEMNQNRKRRRKRKGRKKAERIPQTGPPTLNKKQLQAEQRRREQEMKEIGAELSKKISTVSEKKSAPGKKTNYDVAFDADIWKSIQSQQEEKKKKEKAFQEKMKELDGQEKTQEKRKKRKEKKEKRKQQKLESVPDLLSEPKEECVGEMALKHAEPVNHNLYIGPKLKGCKTPPVRDRATKSSVLHQYFSQPKAQDVGTSRPVPADSDPAPKATKAKGDPALLQKHMNLYNEMMKVQPQRHTEQQLRLEREAERRQQQQRHQNELNRLRGKHCVQVQNLPVKTDVSGQASNSVFQSRQQLLQRQREMERRRNEEEEQSYRMTSMKSAPKKSSPKWYAKQTPAAVGYHNLLPDETPVIPKENIWQKRQEQIEKKNEELQQLVPQSEFDEMRMLDEALSVSQETARREAETRTLLKEQRQSRFAVHKQGPAKDIPKQYPQNLEPPRYVPSYSSKVTGPELKTALKQSQENRSEDASRPRQRTLYEACREREFSQTVEALTTSTWSKEKSEDWESIWDVRPAPVVEHKSHNAANKHVPVSELKNEFSADYAKTFKQPVTTYSDVTKTFKQPVTPYSDVTKTGGGRIGNSQVGNKKRDRESSKMWKKDKETEKPPAPYWSGGENWEEELENESHAHSLEPNQNVSYVVSDPDPSCLHVQAELEDDKIGQSAALTQRQKSWSSFASSSSESSIYASCTSSMETDDWAEDNRTTEQGAASQSDGKSVEAVRDNNAEEEDISLSEVQNRLTSGAWTRRDSYEKMLDENELQDNRDGIVTRKQVQETFSEVHTTTREGTKDNLNVIRDNRDIESVLGRGGQISKEKIPGHSEHETVPVYSNEAVNCVDDSNQLPQRLPALADLTNNSRGVPVGHEIFRETKNEDAARKMATPVKEVDQKNDQESESFEKNRGSTEKCVLQGSDSNLDNVLGQNGPIGNGATAVPGVFPFSLPVHLQQAYLQYLQQTSSLIGSQSSVGFPQFGMLNPLLNPFAMPWMSMYANQQVGNLNQSAVPSEGNLNQSAVPSVGNLNQSSVPSVGNLNQSSVPSVGNLNQSSVPFVGNLPSVGNLNQSAFPSVGNLNQSTVSSEVKQQSQSVALTDISNAYQVKMSEEQSKKEQLVKKQTCESDDQRTHVTEQSEESKQLPTKSEVTNWQTQQINRSVDRIPNQNMTSGTTDVETLRLPKEPSVSIRFPYTRSEMKPISGWMSDVGNIKIKVNLEPAHSEEKRPMPESQPAAQTKLYVPPHKRFERHHDKNGAPETAKTTERSVDRTVQSTGGEKMGRGGFGIPQRKRNWNTSGNNDNSMQEAQNSGRSVGKGTEGFRKPREFKPSAAMDNNRGGPDEVQRGFGGQRNENFNDQRKVWNGQEMTDDRQPRGGFGRPAANERVDELTNSVNQEFPRRRLWKPRMGNSNNNDAETAARNDKENISTPSRGGFGLPGRRNRNPGQNIVDSIEMNSTSENPGERKFETPRRGGFGLPPQKRTTPEHIQLNAGLTTGEYTINNRSNSSTGVNTWQAESRQSGLSERFSNLSIEKDGVTSLQKSSSLRVRKERSRAILDMLKGMRVEDNTEQTTETMEQRSY